MSLISLIWIRKDYEGLVRYASIEHWREILAALCSWTESEFSPLCELLGMPTMTEPLEDDDEFELFNIALDDVFVEFDLESRLFHDFVVIG